MDNGQPSEQIEIVMASANPHKVMELEALLSKLLPNVVVLARPNSLDDVEENGSTLVENARLKACAVRDFTRKDAVADDSGLFVDSLDGAPGVMSARYSGAGDEKNRAKLLGELESISALEPHLRTARFSTIAFLAFADGSELWAQGDCEGTILTQELGTNGFGYDSIFVPSLDQNGNMNSLTFAQMDSSVKNLISHRNKALIAIAALLSEKLSIPRSTP